MTEDPLSDPRIGQAWRMYTIKTAFNSMSPGCTQMFIVDTVDLMNQMIDEIESMGQGLEGFKLLPQSFGDEPNSQIVHLAWDPEFHDWTNLMAGDEYPPWGPIRWIDTKYGCIDYFAYIPFNKAASKFAAIWSLVTWNGPGWIVDYVSFCQDIERRANLPLISKRYPTKEALSKAHMEPTGPAMDQLHNLFTQKEKYRFIGFSGSNDKTAFQALTGIEMVETQNNTGITAVRSQGRLGTGAYMDMQLVANGTWVSELAGYNQMDSGMSTSNKNSVPRLAPVALACGSMENTYKKVVAILVAAIDRAGKGKPVLNTDPNLLALFDETINAPFFDELMSSSQIDKNIYKNLQFRVGESRETSRGHTATRQTQAMQALKKWNKQFSERTSHTVEITGVKYQFGGDI